MRPETGNLRRKNDIRGNSENKRHSQKSTDFMEVLFTFRDDIKMYDTDINDADFEDLRDTDAGRKVE